MSDFYTGLQATAQTLIADKGTSVTVRRITYTFDPITGITTPTGIAQQTLDAALLAGGGSYDRQLPDDQIVGRAKSALLSTVGSTYIPEPLDELLAGDDLWTVFGVSEVNPSNILPVIYKLGLMFKGLESNNPLEPLGECFNLTTNEW